MNHLQPSSPLAHDFLSIHTLRGVFLILLIISPTARAFQWKWLDAQGQVQYSDRPPPSSVPDTKIIKRPVSGASTIKPIEATSYTSTPKIPSIPSLEGELEKKKRQAEEAEASKRKAEEDKQKLARANNCQSARKYEKALNEGYRLIRPNDKGEREVLDEKSIAEEKTRTKSIIASDCR